MNVRCPACSKEFTLDDRRVPPTGMTMRCGRCQTSFSIAPPTLFPVKPSPSVEAISSEGPETGSSGSKTEGARGAGGIVQGGEVRQHGRIVDLPALRKSGSENVPQSDSRFLQRQKPSRINQPSDLPQAKKSDPPSALPQGQRGSDRALSESLSGQEQTWKKEHVSEGDDQPTPRSPQENQEEGVVDLPRRKRGTTGGFGSEPPHFDPKPSDWEFDPSTIPFEDSEVGLPVVKHSGNRGVFGKLDVAKASERPESAKGDELEQMFGLGSNQSDPVTTPRQKRPEHASDSIGDLGVTRRRGAPQPRSSGGIDNAEARAGSGGVGYREIDLGDHPSGVRTEGSSQAGEGGRSISPAPELSDAFPEPGIPRAKLPKEHQRKSPAIKRTAVIAGAIVVLVSVLGFSLSLTRYGLFGVYAVEKVLPAARSHKLVNVAIMRADRLLARDTYESTRKAVALLGRARQAAGLNRRLLAYSVIVSSYGEIRFGGMQRALVQAAAMRQRLQARRDNSPEASLAYVAMELAHDRGGENSLAALRTRLSEGPFIQLAASIEGERWLLSAQDQRAEPAFRAILANSPNDARGLWGLARASFESSSSQMSDAAVSAVLAASPLHVSARLARSRSLIHRNPTRAWKLARQAGGVEKAASGKMGRTGFLWPSPMERAQAWTTMGAYYLEEEALNDAQVAFSQAIAAVREYARAMVGLGEVLLKSGRSAEACARFDSAQGKGVLVDRLAFETRDLKLDAQLGSARCRLAMGQTSEAKSRLDGLSKQYPSDGAVFVVLAKVAEKEGKDSQAVRYYEQSIKSSPNEFDGYVGLAEWYFSHGKTDKALATLRRARGKVFETPSRFRLLGRLELARGESERALRYFRRAIDLNARDAKSWLAYAAALRVSEKYVEAEDALNHVEISPSVRGLTAERARIAETQGRLDVAIDRYQQAMRQYPEDTESAIALARLFLAANRLEDAQGVLDVSIEKSSKNADLYFWQGRVELARREGPAAFESMRKAMTLNTVDLRYRAYAAWAALEANKDLGRVSQFAQQVLDKDPNQPVALWIRARVQLRLGAVQDALRDAKQSLAADSTNFAVFATLGDIYDETQRVGDAIKAYQYAVDGDTTNGFWWYRLGTLRLNASYRQEAVAALRRASALGEKQEPKPEWLATCYRNLGEAIRMGGQTSQSREYFQRYLELAPPGAIERANIEALIENL